MKQKHNSKYRPEHHANPVILEIDEEERCENQSKIVRMSKGKYSGGGFKNIPQTKSKITNNIHSQTSHRPTNTSKLYTTEGIYDQIGISEKQPQYKINDSPNYSNNQSYSISQLQSKISLLKRERDQKNGSLLNIRPEKQYYNISNQPSRIQEAIHVKSSLDEISLENIEAKLEAHRRKMQPVEQQYNNQKGKTSAIDRYSYIKTNVDVDKQYNKIQSLKEDGKIYELAKKKINQKPEQAEFEELWEQRKRENPKIAQYDLKYQQYLLEKDAKNIMGHTIRSRLFNWDKYTQPAHKKSKPKMPSKVHRDHSLSKSPEKTHSKEHKNHDSQIKEEYGPDGLISIKDLKDVIATKDDKFIASYIFAQLDSGKSGLISKEELHQYITSQEHIIKGYNIDTKWLYTDLDNYESKRKGMLTKTELALFLATLQKLQHPKMTLTNTSGITNKSNTSLKFEKTDKSPISSLFHQNKNIFQKLFNALDFNDDKIIKRQQYIENIYIDSDCAQLLDQTVIRINPIDKNITYRQIIACIMDDYRKQKNQKLKKSKQYITFQRFSEYFEVPESIDLRRIDKNIHKKNMDHSTQSELYDIPEECLMMLKDIFNSLPRIYQDYIISVDFVQAALRDPQILALSDELSRLQSIQTRLPLETIGSTLHRIQKQCDQYSNWDSMKLFLSRRGRPLDWDFALILKKRELRAQRMKEEKRTISNSKLRETEKYFDLSSKMTNRSKQKIRKEPDRYTVPEPFDITDMKVQPSDKQAKKGEKQFQELKKQFKARPVNQQILEPKPDLILGKKSKNQSKEKQTPDYYKYQNYENDRIQRALKKAQEQHQLQETVKAIKEQTKVKSTNIGIDLTKKYQDVIKEQKKKQKEIDRKKFKKTEAQVSQNLYPKNAKEEQLKKIEKAKKKAEKADEVAKRKQERIDEENERIKQKNEEVRKVNEEAKKREKEEKELRQKNGYDFKPKINKSKITEEQKEAIRKDKQERQRKKRQAEEEYIKSKDQHRKKILEQQIKSQYRPIQGLAHEEILQHIDQIDFSQLLLDEKSKMEYIKEFPNKNKTRKQLKQRQHGLARRQKAKMQKQEKKMVENKRKYKEKIQKERTSSKKDNHEFSRVSQKGQRTNQEPAFHKSKALRRYRAIMEGKDPLSEFDKYSVQNMENNDDKF